MSSEIDEQLKPIDKILRVSASSQYEEVVVAMQSGLYKGLTFDPKLSENFRAKCIKQMPVKQLMTDLQAQRVRKLQDAKDLRLDMTNANNRYNNHRLKKEADTLNQHLEKYSLASPD
ncbi:MAG TPA: hypothetical protein VHE99_02435 [Gammaproteobacteria bacterium]|nr:hypothetical protein [Gammaproteobacteria bacterium]